MIDSKSGISAIEYAVPLAPRRRSGLGIASFVMALAALGGLVGVFSTIAGRPTSDPLAYKLFGLLLILPLVGTVLGVASICQRRRYRGLAVAGLTINVLLGVFVLLVAVPALLHELSR
jgi:hypothetical protein